MNDLDYEIGEEKMQSFEPLPAGKYEAMIVNSEVKDTKAGNMRQLVLTWRVTSGDHENRVFFDRINIPHPQYSPGSLPENLQTALRIGKGGLDTLCRAVGLTGKLTSSEQLHNTPVSVKLKVTPAKDGYEAGNAVTLYESLVGTPPAQPAQAPKPAAPMNTGAKAGGTPPWKRK